MINGAHDVNVGYGLEISIMHQKQNEIDVNAKQKT